MEEKEVQSKRKNNIRLYPFYRMFSYEIVFLYAIKLIFLTQTKQISASNVILSLSFYALFMIILQVPALILINKLGCRKGAILANWFNVMYIVTLTFSTSLWHLIIAEFISAMSFAIRDIAEPTLIENSIPDTEYRGEIFASLEGKATSRYYILDATTAIASGFLYMINPYIPMICAIICALITTRISYLLEEIAPKTEKENVSAMQKIQEYMLDLRESFKIIFKSKRIRALLLYTGVFWGANCLINEYRPNLLNDINISAAGIGIIDAILGISASIGAKLQKKVHNRFRNRSLGVIGITIAIMTIMIAIFGMLNINIYISFTFIVVGYIVIKLGISMYDVLIKRYLGNFATKKQLPKIYSVNAFSKNLFRVIIMSIGSILIEYNTTAVALLIVGVVFGILMAITLTYMKTRVGLKPEKYLDKKENL